MRARGMQESSSSGEKKKFRKSGEGLLYTSRTGVLGAAADGLKQPWYRRGVRCSVASSVSNGRGARMGRRCGRKVRRGKARQYIQKRLNEGRLRAG
jgi:hypothetical protein